jgi:hypothetical protein
MLPPEENNELENLLNAYEKVEDMYAHSQAGWERYIEATWEELRNRCPDFVNYYEMGRKALADDAAKRDSELAAYKERIEELALERTSGVTGKRWQIRYAKPAVTWDGKLLEGLSIAIPEVAKCRKVAVKGKVSWYRVKE